MAFGRRRRVGEKTRRLYDIEVSQFQIAAHLGDDAEASTIDLALDSQLTHLYFSGATLRALRYRLFAINWHYVMVKADLRLARSTLEGFSKAIGESSRDPVTWEETLLRAKHLLDAGTAEGAELAALVLLAFDRS